LESRSPGIGEPRRVDVGDKQKEGALPHWDLTSVYPGLESAGFRKDVERLEGLLDDLDSYLSGQGIARDGTRLSEPSKLAEVIGGYLDRMNEILRLGVTLYYYAYGFVSTDSYNANAKRALSQLQMLNVRRDRQGVLFQGWLGTAAEDSSSFEAALRIGGSAKEHAFYLKRAAELSRYLMSEAEETLASELALSGADAWGKLQATVTSQVKVLFELHEEPEELPIAVVQNLLTHPDPGLRRRAYEAELEAWESVREPLAACLNGVKGATITLYKRRGRPNALHEAVERAHVDVETLDAMLGAMKSSFPDLRRYWRAKAKRLNKRDLPWWDIWAPVSKSERRYTFDEAREFILEQFGAFHGRMADFAGRAFERGWIDAEPRKGKSIGGFCVELPKVEESRILCNYDGSLAQLITVAHELGHAYHNECQIEKTMLQRVMPLTLAETASIFAQTIVADAALRKAENPDEELYILENILIDAGQVIVDISSRYMFETEVFERRAKAELSADDFCGIMLDCQKKTYGDGLDQRYLHPYMWAWKPHYYSAGESFYNFPYAFGMLFGLGLYKVYEDRGSEFLEQYDNLLATTGEGTAADLAEPFGIDLRGPNFWLGSLDVVRRHIDRYLEL
jgi:pepF/M3 family oligoendopeptidase